MVWITAVVNEKYSYVIVIVWYDVVISLRADGHDDGLMMVMVMLIHCVESLD